jgi:DNA-binding transcriptional ArsR family regulator
MSDNLGRILWYVFATTRGGPTRVRIVQMLLSRPFNMHQLSKELKMDYKTVQHHIKILEENRIIIAEEKKYGTIYFPSPVFEDSKGVFEDIRKKME